MASVATCRTWVSWRGRWTLRSAFPFAAVAVAASIAFAAPAQATPNVGKAWGDNQRGHLGIGTAEGPEKCGAEMLACSTLPVLLSGPSGVTEVVSGGGANSKQEFGLALLENGTVSAWGENGHGQLGNGTTTESDVAVMVSGLSEVVAIAAGSDHGLALLSSGKVMAWGSNEGGQLGDGSTVSSDIPVEVSGLTGAVAIAAGGQDSFAVLSDGTVKAWGGDSSGSLGIGGEFTPTPVSVCSIGANGACPEGPYLSSVKAVATSGETTLALLTSGALASWGFDKQGQLGNGTEVTHRDDPVSVTGLSNVTAIAEGGFGLNGGHPFSLALLSDGTVKAWGDNSRGQLGDGTSAGPETCEEFKSAICAKTPVAVSGLANVRALSARGTHSLALLTDGTVEAWGSNGLGQLGDGTSAGPEICSPPLGEPEPCSTKPIEVGKTDGAKGVGAGDYSGFAFGPPPTVTKVSPKSGPASGEGYVGITGTDFTGATSVNIGSASAASIEVISPTFIFAKTPAGMTAGTVHVTVANAWGTSATSSADVYKVKPAITGLSPNSGPVAGGTSVKVTGSGFGTGPSATSFTFGGKKMTSVSCSSSTECTVVSPPHKAGTFNVRATVNGVGSTVTSATKFTYN